MAKKSVSPEAEERQPEDEMGDLSWVLFELSTAQFYMRKCDEEDSEINLTYLGLLINAAIEKLEYYDIKYGFKVSNDDVFYVEDFADLIRAKDKMMAERKRQEA